LPCKTCPIVLPSDDYTLVDHHKPGLNTWLAFNAPRGVSPEISSNLERVGDYALAETVRKSDDDVDQLNTAMFWEILTYMMSNPRNIDPSTHWLLISENLERTGDRVTKISEQASFLISGEIYEDGDDD